VVKLVKLVRLADKGAMACLDKLALLDATVLLVATAYPVVLGRMACLVAPD